MERKSRIRVSRDELEAIKEAKRDYYGDRADDRPHAEFVVEAAEALAKSERYAEE